MVENKKWPISDAGKLIVNSLIYLGFNEEKAKELLINFYTEEKANEFEELYNNNQTEWIAECPYDENYKING